MPDLMSVTPDCSFSFSEDEVSAENNCLHVKKENATVTMRFEGIPQSECYFVYKGLQYRKKKKTKTQGGKVALYLTDSAGGDGILNHYNENSIDYVGIKDHMVYMGYKENAIDSITICFSQKGYYNFDELGVAFWPVEGLEEGVKRLGADTADTTVKTGKDRIETEVNLTERRLVCFGFTYSDGFRAFVDGREVPLRRVNVKNMGVIVEKGSHRIELIYKTPYLWLGKWISFISFVLFIAGSLLHHFVSKTISKKGKAGR